MTCVLAENRRVLACILFAGAAVPLVAAVQATTAVPVLVALILISLAFATAFHRGLSVLSPFAVIVGSVALTYGVRPLLLLWVHDTVSFVDRLEPETFSIALLAAALFVIAVLASYFSPIGRDVAFQLPVPDETTWSWRRVRYATLLLTGIGLAFYALMLFATGFTLLAAILQPVLFRAQSTRGGLFYISGIALWCLWAVFYVNAVQIAKTSGFTRGKAWLVALFLVLAILTWPYGARMFLLAPILGVFWIRESLYPDKPLRLIVVAPIGAAMLLFVGAYGVYRDLNSAHPVGVVPVAQRIAVEGGTGLLTRVSGRFDSFDFMAWVFGRYQTGRPDYLLGRTAVDFLLQPIPRSLLPAKPSQTSTYLMETFLANYDRSYTPEFGLATEGYINFSWVGVLLAGLLLGVIVRTIEVYLRRARFSPAILFAYAPIVTLPMGWLLAGFNSFTSIMFVLNAVLAWVVVRFLAKAE